ncbi:MAG: hypothetical protein GX476_01315 [Firmicutes bacterium]|nr:hypothetical protein [Bacillota bacterium]
MGVSHVRFSTRETRAALVCLIASCFFAIGLAGARDKPQINLYVVDDWPVSDSGYLEVPVTERQYSEAPAESSAYIYTPSLVQVLNEYGIDEWQTIKGIGPSLASRIVDYRDANGPFESIDDLLGVSGIGPAKLSQIESGLRAQWGW